MTAKAVRRLHAAERDDIGDLVTRRPLPGPGLPQVDPFLFLNHHGPQTYPANNRGLPFGPHPHRGFETVTFILEGSLTHQDSGGHESVIRAGGQAAPPHVLVEMERAGDDVEIGALEDAVLLFGHADAIGEPVAAHGHFVMNTAAEIRQAIADYQAGKFGAL